MPSQSQVDCMRPYTPRKYTIAALVSVVRMIFCALVEVLNFDDGLMVVDIWGNKSRESQIGHLHADSGLWPCS